MDTKGVLLFTRVGKSGFIAQKITQTFVSTGTKAVYLSATDALHRDSGIIGPNDVLVMLSKSGSTEKLLRLSRCTRAKDAYLVGVTLLKNSKLTSVCDMYVYLPLERELCPFDLAPVTSTAIHMLFGDTIAISLMQSKNLTKEQYALNHPAGRIGKHPVFRISLLNVSGAPEQALEKTNKKGNKIVDKLATMEQLASIHLKLGRIEDAETIYRSLVSVNSENYRFHEGL